MLRFHLHSIHTHFVLFPKKLRWLFVAHLLRSLSDQAIGLFVPLFLYLQAQQLAFFSHPLLLGLNELQRGILIIGIYFFLSHLSKVVLLIPLTKFMKKLGLARSMMVANALSVVMYLLLFAAQFNPLLLVVAAMLDGVISALYWIAYYTEFAVHADLHKIGSEVGSIHFLNQLFRAAMPMLGGVLIMSFGFGPSYLTAAVLFLFASLALFFIPEVTFSYQVTLKEFLQWCKKKSFVPTMVGFAGKYIDDACFFIWPIFVYLFLGNIQRVGYMYSMVLFISIILSYFMGWYLGKHKSNRLFLLSGVALGAMWIARGFIGKVWHLLVVETTDRLMLTVYTPIFETYFLRKSLGKRVFHFQAYRSMIVSFTGLLFWPIAVSLFMLPFGWTGLFLLAMVGVGLSLLMRGERHGR